MSIALPCHGRLAACVAALTASLIFSFPIMAETGAGVAETARVTSAPSIPPEAKLLPDPPTAAKRLVARDLSAFGAVAGVALAGWGISVVFQGLTEEEGEGRVHQGIALTLSGSLTASLFSAAMAYYSGPPER